MPFFNLKKYKEEKKRQKRELDKRARKKNKVYKPVEKKHHLRAKKLHAIIKKQGMLMERYDENKWANDFKRLESKVAKSKIQVSPEELDAVLSWYVGKLGIKGLPLCNSVISFRKYFYDILYEKQKDIGPTVAKISKPAQALVDELLSIVYPFWPDNARQQMPAVVQVSFDDYTVFYNKAANKIRELFSKCRREAPKEPFLHKDPKLQRLARYADDLAGKKLGGRWTQGVALFHPETFIRYWFGDVYRERVEWDGWDGRMTREIWSLHHQRYQQQMIAWSEKNGGAELWHEFMEWVNAD